MKTCYYANGYQALFRSIEFPFPYKAKFFLEIFLQSCEKLRAIYNHWTGLVDWAGGLDWWTDTKNHFTDFNKTYSPVDRVTWKPCSLLSAHTVMEQLS